MDMKKYSLICLLILMGTCAIQAQVSRQFWFAPPWMNSHHTGEAEFHLILSAYDQDAHVVISQPADGGRVLCDTVVYAHSYCDILIAPKSDHKIYAEKNIEVPYNTISKRGMLISADNEIGAYYQITHANGEAYTLKGENALGTDFVVMSQNRYSNQANYNGYISHNNSVQIVATEDATTVTIYPSQPVVHDDATTSTAPITIVLNKGETYALKAASTAANAHLIGTRIVADKPIAVTSSDDSVAVGTGQDAVGEQLVPVDMAGTDYTVIPLAKSTYESIYILALHPATTVTLHNETGEETILLDSLQSESRMIKGVTYIHADAEIQVFQLTNKNGESGGTVIPQMLCTGSYNVTYKRIPNSDYTILNILTQTANLGYLYVNGNEIPVENFTLIPGTDGAWSYVSLDVTAKPADMPLEVESLRGVFQLGVVDHASIPQGSLTYGFFSNYANATFIDVMVDDQLLDSTFVLCEQEAVTMIASAPDGVSNFQWYHQGVLVHTGDTLTLENVTLAQAGQYTIQADSRDCTVENKNFYFHVQARQQTIPVTEITIEEGESYTWEVNGETYTTTTRDTVWMPVQYEDIPVMGCDTAVALHVIVRSCVQATLDCPTEICGDQTQLLIPCLIEGSGEYTFSITFDDNAIQAGFQNHQLQYTNGNLVLTLPKNVYANEYKATITLLPAETDCEIQHFEITFLVRYPVTVFVQKWNDVLAVYNDKYNRGEGQEGYRFVAFQWYKDGLPIVGATGSYYYTGPEEKLDFNARYSVLLTREDGTQIQSCEYQPLYTDVPDMVTTTKVVQNAQVVIYRAGKKYNILGVPLQ